MILVEKIKQFSIYNILKEVITFLKQKSTAVIVADEMYSRLSKKQKADKISESEVMMVINALKKPDLKK